MTIRTKLILGLLCLTSFAFMLTSALRQSTVVDELAHISAGYSYDRYLDYRLNPEHPPLMKALAALPLLFFKDLTFPTDNPFWTTAVNGEWGVGGAFLFGLKNNANAILRAARILPILLTIGLIVLTYFWARRILGDKAALIPAALLALSPIILAHGHYVTTDVAAAFGALLGVAAYAEFMVQPTGKNLLWAGLAFGLAEVMKFSTAILAPVFLIITIATAIALSLRDKERGRRRGLRMIGALFLIFLIGIFFVIYPVYAFFISRYPADRQISDTAFTLQYVANGKAPCNIVQCLANADIWATRHAVLRPFAQYVLGIIMVTLRITGTNTSYFLGQVSSRGSPLYFPVVYALKEPLPILLLIAIGIILAIWGILRGIAQKKWHPLAYILNSFPQFTMLIFVITYWVWSMSSPLNIGIRHLIPTLPFLYILATSAVMNARFARPSSILLRNVFIGLLIAWLTIETALASPHDLSYFNELSGGTGNGYRYVDDSNYDWGQDLFALESWLGAHPEVDKFAMDFFGGSNPSYYFGGKYAAWQSSMDNPADHGIHWFIISINNLQNAIQPTAPDYSRPAENGYPWLLALHPKPEGMGEVPPPDYRIGTTLFVYKL